MSIVDRMGLPDCIAGKNRHRLSVSTCRLSQLDLGVPARSCVGPPRRGHCEEEVLGAGPAGCEDRLDPDAELRRVASPALAEALRAAEHKAKEYVMERLGRVQEVLERETARSAPLLRRIQESAVRTTKPKPPSESWSSSKTRRAVRLLPNGGGGGHRTHVRKPSATGIYIISRLSRASRLSAPQPAGSPISQLLMFSPLTPERGLEPVTGI
jgi:hypothetical protein